MESLLQHLISRAEQEGGVDWLKSCLAIKPAIEPALVSGDQAASMPGPSPSLPSAPRSPPLPRRSRSAKRSRRPRVIYSLPSPQSSRAQETSGTKKRRKNRKSRSPSRELSQRGGAELSALPGPHQLIAPIMSASPGTAGGTSSCRSKKITAAAKGYQQPEPPLLTASGLRADRAAARSWRAPAEEAEEDEEEDAVAAVNMPHLPQSQGLSAGVEQDNIQVPADKGRVENVLIQSEFYQTQLPSAEFSVQFDDDELFNVDFDNKAVRWRLPQFGDMASFDTAGALQNKAVNMQNLKIDMKRTNNTAAKPVTPTIQIFTEDPVVLNEPNQLICFVKRIFPPVIKMSWMKNNQPVTEGVSETDFYFASDLSYYKFLYLATIPKEGDVYTCSVEHAGLPNNHTNKIWIPDIPSHVSETSENVMCGLGLAIGIIGIIAGIFLIFKGLKHNQNRGH